MPNLNKDVESWARVSPAAVAAGSEVQTRNVLAMAIEDIARLDRSLQSEITARNNLMVALREKDVAMGMLFDRLREHRIDFSDLIP